MLVILIKLNATAALVDYHCEEGGGGVPARVSRSHTAPTRHAPLPLSLWISVISARLAPEGVPAARGLDCCSVGSSPRSLPSSPTSSLSPCPPAPPLSYASPVSPLSKLAKKTKQKQEPVRLKMAPIVTVLWRCTICGNLSHHNHFNHACLVEVRDFFS